MHLRRKQATIPGRTTEKIMSMEHIVLLPEEGEKIAEGWKHTADCRLRTWSKLADVTITFDKSQKSSPHLHLFQMFLVKWTKRKKWWRVQWMWSVALRTKMCQCVEQEKSSSGVGDSMLDPINKKEEEGRNTLLDAAAGLENDEVSS
jgi:hypothetical protein